MTLKNKVEALLFSSGKPMPEEMLAQLTGETPKEIKKALKALKHNYSEKESALMIFQDEHSWKITVREKYLPLVQKIVADTELSRATLETLAVIAYKSPVLQTEVIKIRGSGAYDHIAELLKLGFMMREKEGRSYKIKLAEKFFEYFDVEGTKDIKEALKDAKQPEPKPDQKKLGDLDVVDVPEESESETPPAEPANEPQPEAQKEEKTELEKAVTAEQSSEEAEKEETPEEEKETVEDAVEPAPSAEEEVEKTTDVPEEVEEEPEADAEEEPETEEMEDNSSEDNTEQDTEKMLEEVEKEIDEFTKDADEETDSEDKKDEE